MTAPTLRSPQEFLWQPRNWTYWVYLVAVVVAFFSLIPSFQGLRLLGAPAAAAAIGVNIGLGVVVGAIIVWLSVIHRPPTTLCFAAVVWGGVVASAIAFYVNEKLLAVLPNLIGVDAANAWGAAIAGPTDEEWLKATGVLAVLALGVRSVTRPIHGLFIGAWCGIGFQVVEDISYAVRGAITNPSTDASGLTQMLGTRGIIALLPSHWVFTACSGLGIGYALVRRDRPLAVRVLVAVGMFAVAWCMHCLWNSPLLATLGIPVFGMLIKLVVILAGFFVVYRLAMRAEWRWYRRVVGTDPALAGATGDVAEPGVDTLVTNDEIRTLRTRRRRHRARRRIRREVRRQVRPAVGRRAATARGKQAARLTRRLHRAQGWLAITAATGPAELPALRTRIRTLRVELAELGAASDTGARRRRHHRDDRQRARSTSSAADRTGSTASAGPGPAGGSAGTGSVEAPVDPD